MADRNAGRFIGTAIGPMLWGTTYIVFVQTLPTDHPVLISALRALPAGLLMLLLVRRLPPLRILLPVTVLALTNIGLFFALLLISAARLPGGITATLAACQPLLVALLAWPLLGRRPGMGQIGLAVLGMAGVGLMVLNGGLAFDLIGVLAGVGAALSMALGIVLMEHWRDLAPPVQMTTWQLLIGGVLILPLALLVEGLPLHWETRNTLGLGYLVLFATALSYWLWVGGVQRLGSRVSVLAFLSPVVALALGVGVMEETLNAQQALGVAMVFLSIGLSVWKRA
ncbi:probable blue pigment (indigoidine) exporter [Paracoccus thiocyanatus]|uniref:Probable blue pigment (Indigoidine) exporter n=1 Tax=Paracoccus thiocyanatus TaxID=34006 RepID=A0A1N6W1W6_9RHOB|nr:EamA family transporter [Paracoccus thiocyanatus]SIQ84173.1 probable blue pigment (indigoidine) exporter [Paracoccus thiocyanatus]